MLIVLLRNWYGDNCWKDLLFSVLFSSETCRDIYQLAFLRYKGLKFHALKQQFIISQGSVDWLGSFASCVINQGHSCGCIQLASGLEGPGRPLPHFWGLDADCWLEMCTPLPHQWSSQQDSLDHLLFGGSELGEWKKKNCTCNWQVSHLLHFFGQARHKTSLDLRGREIDYFLIKEVVCSYKDGRNCWQLSLEIIYCRENYSKCLNSIVVTAGITSHVVNLIL